jgi:hypothetical protein
MNLKEKKRLYLKIRNTVRPSDTSERGQKHFQIP